MSARPTRAGTPGSRTAGLVAAVEECSEFGLESDIGRIEHLAARHDDDIEPTWWLVVAKQLPGQSFGPVSNHGGPYLAGRRDAQPWSGGAVGPDEDGHQAARQAPPGVVEPFEVGSRANMLRRAEPRHKTLPFV